MQKRLLVLIYGVVFIVSGFCTAYGEKVPPVCNCPPTDKPVCASNGETYPNLCMLECYAEVYHHLKYLFDGNCNFVVKPFCFCCVNYGSVCGSDGRTYANMCEFECHRDFFPLKDLKVKHEGECIPRKE